MQIRTKLALQFIVLAAVIFALALLLIYAQFKQHTENEFFTLLESKARMTADMVLRHEGDLLPLAEKVSPEQSTLPYVENTFIYDAQNRCVFAIVPDAGGSRDKWLNQIRSMGVARLQSGEIHAFGTTIRGPSGQDYVVISESRLDDSQLGKLRNILILTFFLVVGMVAWGGNVLCGPGAPTSFAHRAGS